MAKSEPVTIYHIAEEAGVSITTVSRVLNASPKVSEEARNAVMAAIEKLGYVPKAEARARALLVSKRIGVLTPFFTAPSFVQRLRGVATGLGAHHYELIVYTVSSRQHLDSYLASLPITGSLEGLIIISLPISAEQVTHLVRNRLETVLIEYHQAGVNTVEINDQAGGRLAADYLYKKGHRKMAFLGDSNLTEYSITPVHNRLKGFSQRIQELGLALPPQFIAQSPYSSEEGLEKALQVARDLLNQPDPPTAVFAGTDLQAMGVLKAARQMGLKVPGDVAVLGFDDLDMAEYVGLTTISQQLDESGRIAVDLLLSRRRSPERSIQHVQLPLKVIERETV